MSEMVERVARAILKETNPTLAWEGLSMQHQKQFRKRARAAIEEMLKPTGEMIISGENTGTDQYCSGENGNWHEWRDYEPSDVWQAMLREALK